MSSTATAPGASAQSNVPNETWLQFIREAGATKRDIEEASGRHRSVMKRAKAAGCNPKILALAIAAKRQDSAVVLSEVRDTVRVLNLVGVEMTQVDLFGSWTPEVSEKEADAFDQHTAEDFGYRSGKAGQDRAANPNEPGTPFHVAWDAGWIRGQAVIAEQMGPDKKQVTARKERPARTAATGSAPKAATKRGKGKGGGRAAAH